jgi:glycosyltransferase involved in cell wall biosynthesis
MPVRNGARFIREGVESVLAQLAAGDEILVVDDASTDATREILATVKDRRLRVLDGVGRGVSSARNIGLTASAGEFIAFLDHDDLWPLQRHAVLMRALSGAALYDCALGRIRLKIEPDAISLRWFDDFDGRIPPISLCASLFRRGLVDQVGAFAEDLRFGEDIDFLLRLAELNCRSVYVDADTLIYRRHTANTTIDEMGTVDGFMQALRQRRLRVRSQKEAKA